MPTKKASAKKSARLAAAVKTAQGGTPGEIVEAFAERSFRVTIGERTLVLRPLSMGHYNLLESIGSPLVREDAPDVSTQDIMKAAWLLSVPPREGREARDSGALDQLAEELEDELLPAQMDAIQAAFTASLKAAFGTIMPMESTTSGAQKKSRRNGLVPNARRRPGG